MTWNRLSWRAIAFVVLLLAIFAGWWRYRELDERSFQEMQLTARSDPNATNRQLQQWVRRYPNHLPGHLLLLQNLRRLGRLAEARQALGRAMKQGLSEKEGLREAALIASDEDFDKAGGTLLQLLQERPGDVDLLEATAKGLARKQRWEQAEELYTRALSLEPSRRELFLGRGHVRRAQQHYAQAVEDFRRALQGHDKDFDTRLYLADCLLSDARLAEAEPELLHCRHLDPRRQELLLPLATCALARGELEGAQKLLQEAVDANFSLGPAMNELGNIYLLRQRYDLAIPLFEQLVRLHPELKEAHLKLAQALRQKGDQDGSRRHERRYLELEYDEEVRKHRVPEKP